MNIQIMSDLHFEFHRDGGKSFLDSLDTEEIDLLIIAGDLSASDELWQAIQLVCSKYLVNILYVPGNHEYYKSSFETIDSMLLKMSYDNFKILNPGLVEYEGQRFLGSTLWFPFDYRTIGYEMSLNDFIHIEDFRKHVYHKNGEMVRFFQENLKEGDIVITHHAPSFMSVGAQYKTSPLNAFFVCDMEKLILERKPKLWIHGHMHDSKNYMIGETRVVCNPFGYACRDENPDFKERFIVTV